MNIEDFKPCYTWPASVPFRVFYKDEKVRIFIIENITHNWNWLYECKKYILPSDNFFVIGGCYQNDKLVQEAEVIFEILGLNKDNFYLMHNSLKEQKGFDSYGFKGGVINQNAWLKEDVFEVMPEDKLYDAIYVGRRSSVKRHMLANKVRNLAIIAGDNHGNSISEIPKTQYLNPKKLTPSEVKTKINQSRCGLILSAVEGACFASSEYLLCGIPVVSTECLGGRDIWYNDYNSIVVKPDPDEVLYAVNKMVNNPKDPQKIRSMHIEQAEVFRKKFIFEFSKVLKKYGVDIDANYYFRMNFTPKMRGGFLHNEIVSFFKNGYPDKGMR